MTLDSLLDHDFNPLFILLDTKQWKVALKQLHVDPSLAERAVKLSGFHGKECKKLISTVNALHIACKHNAPLDVIESIIRANSTAAFQKESSYQRLPLHVAIMNQCHYKVIGALIESCPKAVSSQDIHGRLPIHYACRDRVNGERYLRYLLKASPESVHVADDKGFLPIHVACRSRMPLMIVNMLLRVGPETILSKTNNGATPVHCAKNVKNDKHNSSSPDEDEIQEQIIELLSSVARETKKVITQETSSVEVNCSRFSTSGTERTRSTCCSSSTTLRSDYGLLRSIRSSISSSPTVNRDCTDDNKDDVPIRISIDHDISLNESTSLNDLSEGSAI